MFLDIETIQIGSHFAIFPLGYYFHLTTSLTVESTFQLKENCFLNKTYDIFTSLCLGEMTTVNTLGT